MIRRLDASTERFLTTLEAQARRTERAQRQLASGKRLLSPSDDPDNVRSLMRLRTELSRVEQIKIDLGRVQAEVDTAEQGLQQAVRVMERAEVLAAAGVTGTATEQQRKILAEEVKALLVEMVSISQLAIEGRYVFSGDADNVAPFQLDWSQPDPVSGYLGGPATRQAMHPAGPTFAIGKSGEEIFDHPDPDKNVFDALNELRLALEANDEEAIRQVIPRLRTATQHLNVQLAFYGTVRNAVDAARNFADQQILQFKTRLSEIEDADAVEAILELNASRYQQEVGLATKARTRELSLFDFLA